jgi:hypothetical protein
MEIILFILLVGVWAAFVLPSFVQSRREKPVSTRPPASGRPTRESFRPPTPADAHRERVLARRRYALVTLAFLAIATLAGAIITGSWPILAASLVVDVLLATYIAVLLQIKQRKQVEHAPPASSHSGGEDAQVVSR